MRQRSSGFTLMECLVVVAIIGALLLLLLPSVGGRGAREAALRNSCLNNVKQINLALHYYRDTHGRFPPAYTVNDAGERLHSWRTLLLPYLEEQALYAQIDFEKPWDDPINAAAMANVPAVYQCPSADLREGQTTYLAVVGPDCLLTEDDTTDFKDVADGGGKTIWLVEAPIESAVPWMAPIDTDATFLTSIGTDETFAHPGVFVVGFVDGHTAPVREDIDPRVFTALTTIAGGESVDDSEY